MNLHEAIQAGNTTAAINLINEGADIHAVDDHGHTPLHEAVSKDNIETVSLLVEKGADIEAHSGNGTSPLQYAISNNKFPCTLSLIKRTEERFHELNIPNNSFGAYLKKQHLIATSKTDEKSE